MKTHRSNRSADQVEAVLIARDYRAKWFSRSFATFREGMAKPDKKLPNPIVMHRLNTI